jgi:hypothetical protein
LKEPGKTGWRIAYLVVRDKAATKFEQHPGSFESFEPVCGRSILYVAGSNGRGASAGFLLDKPVVLKKGIWHAIITLGRQSEVKITENAQVKCLYRPAGAFKK